MASTAPLLSAFHRRFDRWRHHRRIAGIEALAPLAPRPAPLFLVSQLCHRDVRMYLVAITSIYRRIGEGHIVILDDGSLTPADRQMLAHHLNRPRILPIAEVGVGRCPRGGTWERLSTIAELCRDGYVIQVDADLLALSQLDEVVAAYRRNSAFTLAGGRDSRLWSAAEASAQVADHTSRHVQIAAERLLAVLPATAHRRYVRGCSGFAGFPAGSPTHRLVTEISEAMEERLGAKWREWGSEQVASNYVIANCPDAILLPWPRYMSYNPAVAHDDCALIHFYGSCRYAGGLYTALSAGVIERIAAIAAAPA